MTITNNLKKIIKNAIPNRILTHKLPPSAGKSIVLTFDDGPDSKFTPKILDRLKKHNARGIFFVVGSKLEEVPSVYDMIVKEGHIIGNHTYNHPNRIITSTSEFRKELNNCDHAIQMRSGKIPYLIRPPLGLSLAAISAAFSARRRIILWSIEGGEWGVHKHDSTEQITSRLKKNLKSRDILLLHDNNPRTLDILDAILPFLKKEGFDLTSGTNYLLP